MIGLGFDLWGGGGGGIASMPGATLELDPIAGRYRYGAPLSDAPLSSIATFTRATVGTYTDATGAIATAAANAIRADYASAGVPAGWVLEGAVTNLLLNSATLATQSVTVAAVLHRLSFTGTGTVTLSGASTAGPLVGTGANNRVSLSFTPTAGSLTLTVTGSVTLAQLEANYFPSSYFATTGAAAARALDSLSIGGAAFAAIFGAGAPAGVVVCDVTFPQLPSASAEQAICTLSDGTSTNRCFLVGSTTTGNIVAKGNVSGATPSTASAGTPVAGSPFRAGIAWDRASGLYRACMNGGTIRTFTQAGATAFDRLHFGSGQTGSASLNGRLRLARAGAAMTDSAFQAACAPGA